MTALESRIGYSFRDIALLQRALTHSSTGLESYERLEFLGDRVLGVVIARLLYERFPDAREGDLAKRLNALVRMETLTKVADEIGLSGHVKAGAKKNVTASMLADMTEALIAALFLDGGLNAAHDFIARQWDIHLQQNLSVHEDDKSRLQEWAQSRGLDLPRYTQISKTGPDHQPEFVVEAELNNHKAQGRGATKQLAEKAAAAALYIELVRHDGR